MNKCKVLETKDKYSWEVDLAHIEKDEWHFCITITGNNSSVGDTPLIAGIAESKDEAIGAVAGIMQNATSTTSL